MPGLIRCVGATPPNVYFSSSRPGTYRSSLGTGGNHGTRSPTTRIPTNEAHAFTPVGRRRLVHAAQLAQHRLSMPRRSWPLVALVTGAIGAGSSGGEARTTAASAWTTPGVSSEPSRSFAAQCASPRSGTDPFTGGCSDRAGSRSREQLAALVDPDAAVPLGHPDVPDLNPASRHHRLRAAEDERHDRLGSPKDKFHFTYPTLEVERLSPGCRPATARSG